MIEGNFLKNLSRIIAEAKGAQEVLFAVAKAKVTDFKLNIAGLNHLVDEGDSIVPGEVGKISSFNASGKEVKRKDLPLIKKTIPQYRTWKDWHGREHDGIQHRTMDVYPVDFVGPPAEKLIVRIIDGEHYIVSRPLSLSVAQDEILHLANLFLEIFGRFEIFDVVKQKITSVPTRQLHWEVLPSGKYPWAKAAGYVTPYLSKLTPSEKGVIEHRMREISKYEPDFLATGRGGYSGYFVYGFEKRSLYFLESCQLNNATYVFGDDWEDLSALSKGEILNGDEKFERVIHDKKWTGKIRAMLRA